MFRSFASDNNAGVHPAIMQALVAANTGHAVAYGADPATESAQRKFREHFGENTDVFFVFNGTAANVLSIQACLRPYQAVICSKCAHIHTDECGAPEKGSGCKLLPLATETGKLTTELIQTCLNGRGDQHHVQPKLISITQATEFGTVYDINEIRTLADFAHKHDMLLHMDGARLANAAASLDVPLRAITVDAGVDVLSFGGTKNGLMFGEAVVFFNKALARDFLFLRKQGMQLASKMRFIAAQFEALLSEDLWLKNAQHANHKAQELAYKLGKTAQKGKLELVHSVEANAVFARLPQDKIAPLQDRHFFYVWDAEQGIVRWMTSFDTTDGDIDTFVQSVQEILS